MSAFFLTGSVTICPECGSDQVVQLAGPPGPYSSTPINDSSIQDSDINVPISQSLQEVSDALLTSVASFLSKPFVKTDHFSVNVHSG